MAEIETSSQETEENGGTGSSIITTGCEPSSTPCISEFKERARFDSWHEFITRFTVFARRTGQRFVTDDSRIIEKFNFKFSSLSRFPLKLKYGYVKLVCCMASSKKKGRSSRMQRQRTGCKAQIYLNAQKEGAHCFLGITRCSFKHNHPMLFEHRQAATAVQSTHHQKKISGRRRVLRTPVRSLPSRHEFSEHILKSMSEYQRQGYFCDTALLTTSSMIYVHSVILATVCPKLSCSLNRNPFSTHAPNIVDLRPCDVELVECLVDFIYRGCVETRRIAELQKLCRNLGISIFVSGNRGEMIRPATASRSKERTNKEDELCVSFEDKEQTVDGKDLATDQPDDE